MYIKEKVINLYDSIISEENRNIPNGFFYDEEVLKIIGRHIIEKEIDGEVTREKVLKVKFEVFARNRLVPAIRSRYSSVSAFISNIFPEFDIKVFEFDKITRRYWYIEKNRVEYVRWLFKKFNVDKNDRDSIRKITVSLVKRNHGEKAIIAAGGLFNLLNEVLWNKYEIWEITEVPCWNMRLAKCAVTWLLEKKLKYTREQIASWSDLDILYLCYDDDIKKNGLESLWRTMFKGDTVKMVRAFY